ncbi:hypothetical protein [Kytococcus sedentarius]|uniref:hypothetical protein n=1 Tax=Kytococcus sedentarius TaxID=1276 RepID=UPI0035BBF611
MRRALPLIAAGSAAGLALATPLAASATVSALPAATIPVDGADGACAPDQGVTVVVHLEKRTVIRCAEGDPTSGEEALTSAGFELQHDDAGMVCSISYQNKAFPKEGEDGWTCGDFEGDFWSYWTAEAGDAEWTSSQVGAGEHDPAVGDLTGWRYADGTQQPHDGEVPEAAAAEPSEDGGADVTGEASADAGDDTASTSASDGDDDSNDDSNGDWPGWATWALTGGALVVGAGVVAAVLRRR